MLAARFQRGYIDANRAADDIDPAQGASCFVNPLTALGENR